MTAILTALAWASAHWQGLALAAVVLLSLANKLLPGHPRLASTSRWVLDVFALLPMPGAKSALLAWLAGKLGPNAAGAFLDWLAQYLNVPLSPSKSDTPPQAFLARGYARMSLLLILSLLAGCAWSAARKSEIKADLIACGIDVGLGELQTVNDQAHAILADGTISDTEAQAALTALASTAKAGLVKCALELAKDVFGPEPTPAPVADPRLTGAQLTAAPAFVRISPAAESTASRKRRRAAAWLAR